MILAIVTVLFIPVFFWSTGITVETKSFWELSGLIATERIVIEEVNLKGDISECTIYVRNIGKTAIIIDNVFVSISSSFLYSYDQTQFTTNVESVVQGDLITISIGDLRFSPVRDTSYTIQVYTTRGVSDTYHAVA